MEKPLQKTSQQSQHVSTLSTQSLKGKLDILYNRRVCDLAEESKNLAEVEPVKRRESTTQTANIEGKIIEFLWHLKKQGRTDDTIRNRKYMLGILVKFGANLFDPEDVKDKIARYPNWGVSSKAQGVECYSSFVEFLGLTWKPQIGRAHV